MRETDVSLFYREYGSGEPLLLLHGNGENGSYFDRQIESFAARYRVFVIDTRGHGASPRGTAPFSLDQFARDLHDFMDEHGLKKANILGFSDGGNIALLLALRWPGRVKRLIVDGANLYPTGLKLSSLLLVDAAFVATAPISAVSESVKKKRALLRLMACEPHIRPAALSRLTMPVLVLAGTRDIIRKRHTFLIYESLPCAKLCILPGSHSVARENPAAFNKAVLDFLAAD